MAYGVPFGYGWASLDAAVLTLRSRMMLVHGIGWLYRVDAVSYATLSDPYDDDSWTSTPPRLELSAFEVRRWTPCGATLVGMSNYGTDRWVDLRSSRYWQWASRTPTEAVVHFRKRRRAQLQKLERQFARAREELQLAGETYPRKIALLT